MAESSNTFDFEFKIIMLGESGVGKTSMHYLYCETSFYPINNCTIGIEFRVKTIRVDGKRVRATIWDTAGQERFHAISRAHYRGTMGIILCYAINNRESFEKIGYWMKEIRECANEKDVCVVLVGTKSDLADQRVVSTDEGRELAESFGIKFFETSAKNNVNVDKVFTDLARDICAALSKRKDNDDGNGEIEIIAGSQQLNRKGNTSLFRINCFTCY